jgi:molybdate transport system substrate-binding protein
VTAGRHRLIVLIVAATWVLASCAGGAIPSPAASSAATSSAPSTQASNSPGPTIEAGQLTVYGAASLKGALERLKAGYEASHTETTLMISTDSSAALRTQIEQGGPADVFLSADVTNPQKLADAGLADGGPLNFAGNLLTIVVPTGNPGNIATPADLARSGVKIIAAGNDVPITKYANQAVGLLAKAPGYPQDFAASYAANVVSREDNVKALIAKIELGEGDAGIVYVTDARASTTVQTIDIPAQGNVLATYAGVVVKASARRPAAHAFLDWVAGAEGQKTLAGFGFLPPPS